MRHTASRLHRIMRIVAVVLLSLSCVAPASAQDTLINLTQWPVAQGGNDNWYAVLPVAMYWVEAESLAATFEVDGHTGYLATIDNSAENIFIFDSVLLDLDPPTIQDQFFLGGFDTGAGDWTWITGELFCYTNWEEGEPNNVGIETVLSMWGPNQAGSPTPIASWNNTLADDADNPFAQFWSIIEFGSLAPPPDATCGNGIVECGESCDDGNLISNDGCDQSCDWEFVCGDGAVVPGEECDDGNVDSLDGCFNCEIGSVCGDGIANFTEECDDGNNIAGDGCDPFCRYELICGDGNLVPGEECDDGNTVSGDGCDGDCQYEHTCGDGNLELGEECDDGNTVSGDSCSADCLIEFQCSDIQHGDVNGSGALTSADIIYLVNYVFRSGPVPQPCEANGDVNCDGQVTAADIIRELLYVFKGDVPPCNTCIDSPLGALCVP